jgi:hypothetical protein
MRRITVTGTLLGILVLTTGTTMAWADGPLHERSGFSESGTIPAGELCDFAYSQTVTIFQNSIIFGTSDDPDRTITQAEAQVTHTNLDTAFTLTEVDHLVLQFDAADSQFKATGIQWHLRDADGKLILIQAGQLVVNADTGEIVKLTPSINPDFAAVVCPALGGQPAS